LEFKLCVVALVQAVFGLVALLQADGSRSGWSSCLGSA
jgi:hypothetical protein